MSTEDAPLPAAPRIEGPPPHLLVVRAPYYRAVIDGLTDGASRILREAGATFEQLDVAGALRTATGDPHRNARRRSGSTASSRWAAWCAARPTTTNSSAARRWAA